ncbi:hypothetical protein Gotur_029977, partial [Gossypium turneri]
MMEEELTCIAKLKEHMEQMMEMMTTMVKCKAKVGEPREVDKEKSIMDEEVHKFNLI